MRLRNWWRQYDGGLFTNQSDGIEYRIVLKDGSGKHRHMRRYSVSAAGKHLGDRKYLVDAKRLAQDYENRRD